jgi:hypothetical protein
LQQPAAQDVCLGIAQLAWWALYQLFSRAEDENGSGSITSEQRQQEGPVDELFKEKRRPV